MKIEIRILKVVLKFFENLFSIWKVGTKTWLNQVIMHIRQIILKIIKTKPTSLAKVQLSLDVNQKMKNPTQTKANSLRTVSTAVGKIDPVSALQKCPSCFEGRPVACSFSLCRHLVLHPSLVLTVRLVKLWGGSAKW